MKAKGKGAGRSNLLEHWYTLIDGFQYSTTDFYDEIEKELVVRQVPRLNISRVEYHEGSILSDKRLYLRLARERFAFDICAAPFGRSYFFSLRLVEIPRLRLLPILVVLMLLGGLLAVLKGCFSSPYQQFGQVQNQSSGLQVFLWIIAIVAVIVFFFFFAGKISTPTSAAPTVGGETLLSALGSDTNAEPVEVALAKHGLEIEPTESGSMESEKEVPTTVRTLSAGDLDLGSFILSLPIIGEWYEGFRKDTYYRYDTRLMYFTLVSNVVKKKVEQITAEKGVELVREFTHSPAFADLYTVKQTTVKERKAGLA